MKILLINKFYHDKGKAGGVGRHILELQKMLEQNGHEVVPFAMREKETIPNDYLEFFPKEFDLSKITFDLKGLKNVFKIFYNREAVRKLEKLLQKEKPEIAHIHNIYHHLSPAILAVLKKYGIPTVMTVHDYKLICPNYLMFNNRKICEKCSGKKFYKCFTNKCVKDYYSASLILALEAYFVKLKKYYQDVDIFITPSLFMRDKLVENGFDGKKIKYLPNFFESINVNNNNSSNNAESEKYFLYCGRLSKEKGVDVLIKSLQNVDLKDYKLKIAGSGDEKESLENLASSLKLAGKIEFVGYKSGKYLNNLISKAKFIVVPSIWYENAPYSILEAFAFGKPVIGSRIGGIPEMIEEGETGCLFDSGNEKELGSKIKNLIDKPIYAEVMGENAKAVLAKKYAPNGYRNQLIGIYSELKMTRLG